jgi:hypothetical protein
MLEGNYHATRARAGLGVDMADSPDDPKAAPIIEVDCGVRQLIETCVRDRNRFRLSQHVRIELAFQMGELVFQ